jgi:hypothetical protein
MTRADCRSLPSDVIELLDIVHRNFPHLKAVGMKQRERRLIPVVGWYVARHRRRCYAAGGKAGLPPTPLLLRQFAATWSRLIFPMPKLLLKPPSAEIWFSSVAVLH